MKPTTKYKLIVLDLDGTLTNSKKEISPNNKEVLMRAQQMGVKIALASGRPTPGIVKLARELELHNYGGFILSYNGGKIIDCTNETTVYQNTLPDHILPHLYQTANEFELSIIRYEDDNILTETTDDQYIDYESWLCSMNIKIVDDFTGHIQQSTPKCLMLGDGEKVARVIDKVRDRFPDLSITSSEPFFLEVMPQGVDKALSLARLLDHLNIDRTQMIACGDGLNDLSMIKFAGLGVAMANAHPQVKEAASYITLNNDNDGVAHAIERFIFESHNN